MPAIKAGQVKPLAVTSAERLTQLPEVLTFAEVGVPGLDLSGWAMFVVPASSPTPIVQRLNATLVKVISTAAVRNRFDELGVKITPSTPEQARAMLTTEVAKWRKIVELANARIGD